MDEVVRGNAVPYSFHGGLVNFFIDTLAVVCLNAEDEVAQLSVLDKHLLKDGFSEGEVGLPFGQLLKLLVEEYNVAGCFQVLQDHQLEFLLGESIVLIHLPLLVLL